MNRILQFALFFLVFFGVYLGMHAYIFFRMSTLLAIKRSIWFYAVLIFMALGFPLISIIERTIDGKIANFFYTLSATWLGAAFYFVCVLALYEIARLVFKIKPMVAGIAILAIVTLIVVYGIINAFFINVKEITVPIPNLDKELTVVQLSDIHIGTIHNSEYVTRIAEKVNALKPDMVLITGDLVDGSGKIDAHSVAPLNKIKAKTFFTTGNHEVYEGIDEMLKLLATTNVTVLRNKVVTYKGIQIIGIDYPASEFGKNNTIISDMKFDKSKPSVLMYHPPSGLEDANAAGVNLQLSGHTHRGQIIPFNLATHLVFKRTYGLYDYNGTYLYVSPGTGTWGPPMRIGSQSEITLIRLVKE